MNKPLASIFLAAALALAAAGAYAAEAPADGLYLAATGVPAPEFRTEDGETVFLGAKQDLKLLDKSLKFRGVDFLQLDPLYFGNWDATFNLELKAAYEEMNRSHVLVVAGTVYRQGGASAFTTQTSSSSTLHFGIWDEKHAAEVAQYFGIPVQYPTHPGHRLRVWFTPGKPSFARGEPVAVTVHITNLGSEPFTFMKMAGSLHGPPWVRTTQFVFAAYDSGKSVPDIGSPTHPADTMETGATVPPGGTYEETADLANWFEFREAGQYQVHGAYFLKFIEPEARKFDIIWTEYASSNFTVRIK